MALTHQILSGEIGADTHVVVDDVSKVALATPIHDNLGDALIAAQQPLDFGINVGADHQQAIDALFHQHA